jgi:hypothetical protein
MYNLLMVLVVLLAVLLLIFLLMRHHVGVPFLAMVAGVALYDAFGATFAQTINQWIPAADVWWTEKALFALFVAVMPLIIYFRVGRSGLFGVLRIIESIIFALLLTILLAPHLADFFSFDNTSIELANWIVGIRGIVMVVGVILAYVDVFFYRSS